MKDLGALLRAGVEEGLAEAMDHVLEVAQGNVTVDTGELRDSGYAEVSGTTGTVGFTAPHATSVHENHRGVSTSPKFLETALASERRSILRTVSEKVRDAMGG